MRCHGSFIAHTHQSYIICTVYINCSLHTGLLFLADQQAILQNEMYKSVFLPAIPTRRFTELPPCWDRNVKLLPGISNLEYTHVPNWTATQVVDFVKSVVPTLTTAQEQLFVEQVHTTLFLFVAETIKV